MTDASFQAVGYWVLIEDDPNQKYTSTKKIYAAGQKQFYCPRSKCEFTLKIS